MSTSVITVGANSVTLVSLPTSPGLRSVEFSFSDAVSIVASPFTGQVQAQSWPGADSLMGTMTLPPLTQCEADDWIAFLMECRGMMNAFQIGDPLKQIPWGAVTGAYPPVVDGSVSVTGMTTLTVRGLKPNALRLLVPGDYFQLGYRMHRVVSPVNADSAGKATISFFPSLRETPADGTALVLNGCKGLFRLATNKRTWSADYTRLSAISFQILEYR